MSTTTKKFCASCQQEFPSDEETCPTCEIPLTAIAVSNLIGVVVDGRYTITDVLGRGGMGVVYRARQAYLDRDVALKVMRRDLSEDTDMIRRFLQEAKSASKLTSPHTVTIHDFGLTPDGQMYFTMELLEGISLGELTLAEGTIPFPRAVRLAVQCCHSLSEAHGHGIWHRDMKPENVIITRGKRGQDHAKILDFGIAKVRGDDQAKTQTGMIFGTPRYLSPEQTNALDVDQRTDLYSLGVMLYEMLMGMAPFDGESTVSVLMSHVQKPPPPFAEKNPAVQVPRALEDAVMWALAKRPGDRPPTAEAFATALLESIGEDSETGLGRYTEEEVFSAPPGASDAVPMAEAWEDPEGSDFGERTSDTQPLMTAEIDRVIAEIEERTSEGQEADKADDGAAPGAPMDPIEETLPAEDDGLLPSASIPDDEDDEFTRPGAFRADHRRGLLIGSLVLVATLGLVGLGLWQPWVPAAPPAKEDVKATKRDVPVAAPVTDVITAELTPEVAAATEVVPEDLAPEDIVPEIVPTAEVISEDIGPEPGPEPVPEIVTEDVTAEITPPVDVTPDAPAPEIVPEDVTEKKDPPKKDPPKDDPPKKDPPKKDPPKRDPPKDDPPKDDPPKDDPPKDDPPKDDPPKKDPEDEYTEIPS